MKRTAMIFSFVFIMLLLSGLVYVIQGFHVLGGVIMITSGIGANLSILLYDTPRLMSKGLFGVYKWQDDVLILSTVIALGTSLLIVL